MNLLPARFVAPVVGSALAACGLLPETPVPPPKECGFPEGAPLAFAGRSTTGALDVQQHLGDPLASHPADIYITRDEIDGPAGKGQAVCMILVDQPTFVEITLVPEGWDLETGRPPPESGAAEPSEPGPPPQPEDGLARDDAIGIARAAFPHVEDWEVYAFYGPATEMLGGIEMFEGAQAIPADRWLWSLNFMSGSSTGTWVYLDYVDGTVYGSYNWIE